VIRAFGTDVKVAARSRGVEIHGTCECGNEARIGERACDRCLWLDGRTPLIGNVIEILREQRFASVENIADELGVKKRNVLRALAELRRLGRVASEIDHVERRYGWGREFHDWSDTKVWRLCDRRAP